MLSKMVKITKVEENGNGADVTLSNGRKHWIANDNWTTKEELKEAVRAAENFVKRKNTAQEKADMQTLVGEVL
jgi:uncharacterized protein YgiM (DUF1202 family)